MIFGSSRGGLGGAAGPIKTIQLDLQKIGLPVRATGTLDQATVDAINGVFNGSVDVPLDLRSGNLSMHDIARKLPVVSKSLKTIVRGSQTFSNVNDG